MTRPVIPEGTLIEVALTIRLPHAAAPDHISEWLEMEVGRFGTLSLDNPLLNDEPESWGYTKPQWRDTGMRGREIESPRVKGKDGVIRYSTRYVTEVQS